MPPWYRYHPLKYTRPEPAPIDRAFDTTGGKGLIHGLIERDENTLAAAIRREQLTRLGCIREQLARNQAVVWNNADEAGEWQRTDLPEGVGIYVWPLDEDERQALIAEASDLRAVLHV